MSTATVETLHPGDWVKVKDPDDQEPYSAQVLFTDAPSVALEVHTSEGPRVNIIRHLDRVTPFKRFVTLIHQAPVYVEVDLLEQEVRRVVVGDDELRPPHAAQGSLGRDSEVYQIDVNGDEAERAKSVCDDVAWPAWQFGW